MWLAANYALRRCLAISERQGQSMGDVRTDGGYERLVGVAVEELDLYALVAAQLRRAQTMHAVDDSQGLPVHDNRRPVDARLSQHGYVIGALAVEAGRIRRYQRPAWNYLDAWLNQRPPGSVARVCGLVGEVTSRRVVQLAACESSRWRVPVCTMAR